MPWQPIKLKGKVIIILLLLFFFKCNKLGKFIAQDMLGAYSNPKTEIAVTEPQALA